MEINTDGLEHRHPANIGWMGKFLLAGVPFAQLKSGHQIVGAIFLTVDWKFADKQGKEAQLIHVMN
jgi:hypothetical protein